MNKLTINHSLDDVDREEIRRRDAALPRLTVATLKILKVRASPRKGTTGNSPPFPGVPQQARIWPVGAERREKGTENPLPCAAGPRAA